MSEIQNEMAPHVGPQPVMRKFKNFDELCAALADANSELHEYKRIFFHGRIDTGPARCDLEGYFRYVEMEPQP